MMLQPKVRFLCALLFVLQVGCGDDQVAACPAGLMLEGTLCVPVVDAGTDAIADGSSDVTADSGSDDAATPGLRLRPMRDVYVARSDSAQIQVGVERTGGFEGEVNVRVVGLPDAVTVNDARIPSGESTVELTFEGSPSAAPGERSQVMLIAESEAAGLEASEEFLLYVRGAPGTTDITFDYLPITPRDESGVTLAMDLVVEADGRILVYGAIHADGERSGYMTRVTQDGAVDTTFGEGGELREFGLPESEVGAVLFDDERILVGANRFDGVLAPYMLALTPDGQIDASFGEGGEVSLPHQVTFLRKKGDGYLAAAGLQAPMEGMMTEITATGSTSVFAAATSPFLPAFVSTDDDGRVLVGGELLTVEQAQFGRIGSDGVLDSSFGSSGIAEIPLAESARAEVSHILPADDGGGYCLVYAEYREHWLMVFRYLEDGSLDTNFGAFGDVGVLATSMGSPGGHLRMRSDGRLLVIYPDAAGSSVVQITATGSVDQRFNGGVPLNFSAQLRYDPSGERLVGLVVSDRTVELSRVWL